MNRKLKIVFLTATIAAISIFVFQAYWIFNTYTQVERNFKNNIEYALKVSVDSYRSGLVNTSTIFNEKVPYLYLMDSEKIYNAKSKGFVDNVTFSPVKIEDYKVEAVRMMMAQLMADQLKEPIDLNQLKIKLKQELLKKDINLDFNLGFVDSSKADLTNGVFVPSYQNSKTMIELKLDGLTHYLLKKNMLSLLVSVALIILSAGSLYFMGVIIKRQIKLDDFKNEFINNITHELRTPISILKSTHEVLLKFSGLNDPEKAVRYLNINSQILTKLDHNVDRILDIAQLKIVEDTAKYEHVKLNSLIESIIERFRVNPKININYRCDLLNDTFFTDPYFMEVIISNLLDNAIKYSDDEVKINIEVAFIDDYLQIIIQDTGKGIDKKYQSYIYDDFFRVPEGDLHTVKGYGLGLSYVKKTIAMLNGRIHVKSKLGIGTTFTINLPSA